MAFTGSHFEVNSTMAFNRFNAEMNPKLWSLLPGQMIEKVLSLLPFHTFVKMRCVCKGWNALILTGTCPPPSPNPKTVILWTTPGKLFLTSIPSRRSLGLPFLPNSARSDMELAATSQGLLCLRRASTDEFMVCNPMTQCWRKLPSVHDHRIAGRGFWTVAGLCYNTHRRAFKVFAVFFAKVGENCNYELKCTKIYNSTTDSWTLILQDGPRPIVVGPVTLGKKNFKDKSFFHGKFLYVMDSEDNNQTSGHVVLIFSLEKLSWIELGVEGFTQNQRPANLVSCKGRIYLVAEEEESPSGFGTIGIWKLDVLGGTAAFWTHQDSSDVEKRPWLNVRHIYPGTLVSKNCKGGNFRWSCLVREDKFCFLVTQLNPGGSRRNPVTELVEYDLFDESWAQQWLDIHDVPDAEFCSFQPSIISIAEPSVSDRSPHQVG